MDKNITTIAGLAEMIQCTMASKEDIKAVTTRLDGIDSRLDRIETLLLEEQKRDIENLKTRVKRLEDGLCQLSRQRGQNRVSLHSLSPVFTRNVRD